MLSTPVKSFLKVGHGREWFSIERTQVYEIDPRAGKSLEEIAAIVQLDECQPGDKYFCAIVINDFGALVSMLRPSPGLTPKGGREFILALHQGIRNSVQIQGRFVWFLGSDEVLGWKN